MPTFINECRCVNDLSIIDLLPTILTDCRLIAIRRIAIYADITQSGRVSVS